MIQSFTYGEYADLVRRFHGFEAPGVLIGGFMVDLAY
jgi:formylmethanofuran dehydrogenase subunit E